MQKLIVKNFGPLTDIDLEIKDFMVFIGPQASGKSTIAKLVWFFKTVSNELISTVTPSIILHPDEDTSNLHDQFVDSLIKKLVNIFPSINATKQASSIKYVYNNDLFFTINIDANKNISFQNSEEFFKKLIESQSIFGGKKTPKFLSKLIKMLRKVSKEDTDTLQKGIQSGISSVRRALDSIYIPSGRTLLTTFNPTIRSRVFGATSLLNIYEKNTSNYFDWMMNAYAERRDILMSKFYDTKKENLLSVNNKLIAAPFQERVAHILNAKKYTVDELGNEHLFLSPEMSIPIGHASSGQQESISIILDMIDLMESSTKRDVVIEEPESHLYPIAQKDMLEIIALAYNAIPGNQFIITTHSPYILTSLNNLIVAYKTGHGTENQDAVDAIIPEACWLDPARVGAYYVGGTIDGKDNTGEIKPIIGESGLIGENELDDASDDIGDEFDAIMEIRRKQRTKQQ